MSGNSWEVDSYREGKWRISVRANPENDRVDEGDFPDGHLSAQRIHNSTGVQQFNVFKDNVHIAEVTGTGENKTIRPVVKMNDEEEDELNRFLDDHAHFTW